MEDRGEVCIINNRKTVDTIRRPGGLRLKPGLKPDPDIPGGSPGRIVSNVLARLLMLINLRRVKLRVGLGRGVRYYKEL